MAPIETHQAQLLVGARPANCCRVEERVGDRLVKPPLTLVGAPPEVDRVGYHLLAQTECHPGLADLVAGIRIAIRPRPPKTVAKTTTTKGTAR